MGCKENIKQLRKDLGYTQERLAQDLGVATMTIKRWEAGTSKPSQLAQRQLHRLRKRLK